MYKYIRIRMTVLDSERTLDCQLFYLDICINFLAKITE